MVNEFGVPDLRSELERKTADYFAEILWAFENSSATKQQTLAGLAVLWNMCSGLVSNQLALRIAEAHELILREGQE